MKIYYKDENVRGGLKGMSTRSSTEDGAALGPGVGEDVEVLVPEHGVEHAQRKGTEHVPDRMA
jgi:hypothetical protein